MGLFDGYPLQHLLLSHFITCYLVVGLVWLWEAFEAVEVRIVGLCKVLHV